MRRASAWAPFTPSLPKEVPCTQAVVRPSWQKWQVPSELAKGMTTTSPCLTVRTSRPRRARLPSRCSSFLELVLLVGDLLHPFHVGRFGPRPERVAREVQRRAPGSRPPPPKRALALCRPRRVRRRRPRLGRDRIGERRRNSVQRRQ